MRAGPTAALAAAIALLAIPAAAGAQPSLGYNEDLHALHGEGRLESALADIEAQGARTVRLNVYACRATAPGGWEQYDEVVAGIHDHGLRAVVMVGGVPGHGCERAWEPPLSDAGWTAWHGFVAEAVRRTWRIADAYELWNEPNLPAFWPAAIDPAAYAGLMAFAQHAIAAATVALCAHEGECGLEPRIAVAGLGRPALRCRDRPSAAPVCARDYLSATLERLDPAAVDAVGLHLYPEGGPRASNRTARDEALSQYDVLDAAIERAGFGEEARLVTEVGFRTRTDPNRCDGGSESDQASRLAETWRGLGERPNLETVQIHRFADSRHEVCDAGPYQAYGVMGPDYGPDGFHPKRSYCSLAALLDRDPPKC